MGMEETSESKIVERTAEAVLSPLIEFDEELRAAINNEFF